MMADEPVIEERLTECERLCGYTFRDRSLLLLGLTHASVAPTRLDSNERLEFLGDAILGFLVSELIFDRFPEEPEGVLTRIKSALVSRETCARISDRLQLDRVLLVGKGVSINEAVPRSVMGGAFESVIAALYLDGGFGVVRPFVLRMIEEELELLAEEQHLRNYKSQLQQTTQKENGETPSYQLLDEKGPDHAKCFKVSAVVGEDTFTAAWGASKKEAEQRAARNALLELQGQPPVYTGE